MNKLSNFIVILLLIVLITGGVYYLNYKNLEDERRTEKITGYANLFANLFDLEEGDDARVERAFSENIITGGEEIEVTISVIIDPEHSHQAWAIEETVPSGWSITDSGSAIKNENKLKWSKINDEGEVESRDYSYKVRAPDLTRNYYFHFSGYYAFDGMDNSKTIAGNQSIKVIEEDCDENLVNTSWSEWMNETCLKNDTMRQSRYLIQYDKNNCGITKNKTFFEYRTGLSCDSETFKPKINHKWERFNLQKTTNFSAFNKTELKNLENVSFYYSNNKSELNFLENVNISRNLNLSKNLEMGEKWVYLDPEFLPEFNKRVRIQFSDIDLDDPVIYKDKTECPETICTNQSYNGNNYSFEVLGFSNYSVQEGPYCGDGICDSTEGEDCSSCPEDCGECESSDNGGGSGGSGGSGGVLLDNESSETEENTSNESDSQKTDNQEENSTAEEKETEQDQGERSLKDNLILIILIIVLLVLLIAIGFVIWLYYKQKNLEDYLHI